MKLKRTTVIVTTLAALLFCGCTPHDPYRAEVGVATMQDIEQHFGGSGYAKLKEELADVTIQFLEPFQEDVRAIDDGKLDQILEQGAARAQSIARATYLNAKERMGLRGARKN